MTSTPLPTPINEASLLVIGGDRTTSSATVQIKDQKINRGAVIAFSLKRKKAREIAKIMNAVNSTWIEVIILS